MSETRLLSILTSMEVQNASELMRMINHRATTHSEDKSWLIEQAISCITSREKGACVFDPEKYQIYLELCTNNKIGWSHPMFVKFSQKQAEEDEFIVKPYEVEEGVLTCLKCLSKKVYSTSVQMRSADEPMTTIAQCAQCGSKWTS
jgi:DNA-directed RNA polymerase subunit M/transcription elongation factor TFIIS